ncbi:hypothetical protein TRAPUB_5256 [Trametes pubescens]|uniref:Uncharacterized protein n=1 Tax=Trametes pubescens TaxID=154538 RepID=A0A1M2V8Q4_TRAPU|nr:hypothetical protein TRAPUB_5256 [Trametes pubescens]
MSTPIISYSLRDVPPRVGIFDEDFADEDDDDEKDEEEDDDDGDEDDDDDDLPS